MSSRLYKIMNGPPEPDLEQLEGMSGKVQQRILLGYLDWNKNFDEAVDKFKQAKMMKIIAMEYALGKIDSQMNAMKDYEKELESDLKEETAKEHNNTHVWVTVSPKPTVKFIDFRKVVEKLVNRKLFSKYCYTYEQRGKTEDELGQGFHVHILGKRNLNYKPNKVVTHIKNTLKNICDVEKCCRIQIIGEDFAKDKIDYMTGIKTGGADNDAEDKQLKQAMDVKWREREELLEYYGEKII